MRRATILLCILAAPAQAGRTNYGWLPSTTTIADGGLELEMSIYERDDLGRYHERSSALALTPTFGVTDALELAFPVELVSRTAIDVAPGLDFTRFGGEIRYRALPRSSPVAVIVRAGVSRDVTVRTQLRSELESAVSYDLDRWQFEADLGGVLDFNIGHLHSELHPGLGTSARIAGELRVGAELHAELSGDTTAQSWAVLGPNLAWHRDRYWLAGALDFGIHAITAAPRLNLGMVW
jgi:hypothetical protein